MSRMLIQNELLAQHRAEGIFKVALHRTLSLPCLPLPSSCPTSFSHHTALTHSHTPHCSFTQASAAVFTDVQRVFKTLTKAQRNALGSGIMKGAIANYAVVLMKQYKNTGDVSVASAKKVVRPQHLAHTCTHT